MSLARMLKASREKARGVENDVALKVRQLYYNILVVQSKQQAIEANIRAVEDQQSERVQQVKYGSTLEVDLIESRAQLLQAKQELLTAEMQLSDLRLKFNDIVGLPLKTEVALDPNVPAPAESCEREQCIKLALDSHPEITEARADVEKASAGVRAAKREYIPDIEAFARYSYQENVPFLARNFGTFGVHFGYDLFDGGKKRATLRERDAQLAQAKENLARISDEVEVRVQSAYNKLERTQQMVAVSQELLADPARGPASFRTAAATGHLSSLAGRRRCRAGVRGPDAPAAIPTRIRSSPGRIDRRDRTNGKVIALDQ